MGNRYRSLIKNIGYLTIGNFASKILTFLLVPVYTYVLTTEEYGTYDAIVTTMQLLAPIVTLNIGEGAMRFCLTELKKQNQILKISYLYLALGILLSAVFLALNGIFHPISFLNGYEGIAFLYCLFYILYNFFTQYAKGVNKVACMSIAGVIATVSIIVFNLLFLLVFRIGIRGFFYANILGQAIPVVYYLLALPCRIKKEETDETEDRALRREMTRYSLPLIFNTLGWTINSSLDKYCVIFFIGEAANGVLAVAYKIPTILSVVWSIFTQAWQISAVNEYGSKDRKKFYSEMFLITNAVGALFCAGLILLTRPVSAFLFSKEFSEAWQYVPGLLISTLFNQTAGFVGPLLSAKKNSKAMAWASLAGTAVNLIFNILFIQWFGIQGAVIATAISSFVIYLVRYLFVRELLDTKIQLYLCATWLILILEAVAVVCSWHFMIYLMCFLFVILVNLKFYGKALKLFRSKGQ